ncbi:hypothetical protein B5P20_16325 [Clavibacter sepedonicus]|uniref:Uncharacterized protein n=1 Tax=Clavibacter sepedonicus TaxID=31964 RepID=B0RJH0_CLASE|nr:hypothetical protein B5P20_16325 [Clavibacter sepedonicus]CAQ03360.1 hypothetical protein pCSL0118 [Clavibacter sepedonicus]
MSTDRVLNVSVKTKTAALVVRPLLSGAERQRLRPELTCPECEADAYFVRRAINGRPACFGARPHNADCSLATTSGEGGAGHLEDVAAIDAEDGGLVLRPMNADAPDHVTDEADDDAKARRGQRHGGTPVPGRSRRGMNLNRLLRRLIRIPGFATSTELLTLPDGTQTTVRDWCVFADPAAATLVDRRRIFWGTIRFANTDDDSNGAWLNLGRGSHPTIRLERDLLAAVLSRIRAPPKSRYSYWNVPHAHSIGRKSTRDEGS